ncbi:MAG: hypothetical protein CL685_02260 [Candidatus Magasanikbacteria bacterium]|nr:hypothetical protein [Candidatus Magasanikbacteria bacterium]|tara:strand:- start:1384 stop:2241 length:858 start_codon:yes stop_codon:yes gene_type:complete
MDLSIITVNTNAKDTILSQIQSTISGAGDLVFEHIVSDNGSTDGSVEEIKRQFPQVRIIENKANIGFGSANNAALPYCTGKYILLLNPDMRVLPNSLHTLIAWMNTRPEIGIASCKLTDESGKASEGAKPRRFPTLVDQLAVLLKIPHLFPHILDTYLYKGFDFEKEQEVDSVRGSFMLIRKSIVDELGWIFDPRYFIWFEDVDTCKEVKKRGYSIVYTPIISCVDYIGQTFKQLPSMQKQLWFTKSMVQYFKKWHTKTEWIIIVLCRPIALLLTTLHTILRKKT